MNLSTIYFCCGVLSFLFCLFGAWCYRFALWAVVAFGALFAVFAGILLCAKP